jgi:aspartate/tyrosine/aromatic aminotransferase
MFENVPVAPPDAIFGLMEIFRQDRNPDKVNLCAGVYKDGQGRTPVLAAVKEAERRILADEATKTYLPISGLETYAAAVQELIFGPESAIVGDGRAVTVQTPGGTGALRVAGDFLKSQAPDGTLWATAPTWPNHPQIFAAAGLAYETFPYFDTGTSRLAFDALLEGLARLKPGDIVLLHGCCHNPSGVDPNAEQWSGIADVLAERGALPLVDFAYQGFAEGLDEDAAAVRILCDRLPEVLVCSSYSKNFGLYKERVGALTAVAADAGTAKAVLSQLKATVRANYSNPPSHGALAVATVLADAELRRSWEDELRGMRERIRQVRLQLVEGLDQRGVRLSEDGNGFIAEQNGMFSFSRLNPEQVTALRERFAIYAVGSGRINVAGLTADNLDRVCDAVAAVVS